MVWMPQMASVALAAVVVIGSGAAVGQERSPRMCGGIAGLTCPAGSVCVMGGPPLPDQSGLCRPKAAGVMCPAIFQPVCGADGKTYSNRCVAERAGATVARPGQCDGPTPPASKPSAPQPFGERG